MKNVDYFEETMRVLDGGDRSEELRLIEKLKNAFVTPIDKEDIFSLYVIALEAKQKNFVSTQNILREICRARSLKGAIKPLKAFYTSNDDSDEINCIRAICKILLKNS